ncbi:class I adenylate-forming enzyme family protein [Noviherbaspirillum sp. ST9]|uniref:class I adenylate-forming enzyme family protein n=1 Tax=Noviherbaspirillum sp. ST9 TaxID=3401606 RepID=UPI003B588143
MSIWEIRQPATRMESHFGDRLVQCCAERPGSVYAMFADAVARNPDGEAVVCGDRRLSWRALHAEAMAAAGGFAQRGIGKGDRIALLLGNDIEFMVVTLAGAALGAIVVPLSIREQAPGIAYILEHCGASAIVHDAELADRLPAKDPRVRICVGDDGVATPFAALLAGPALGQPAKVEEEDVAVILYTSGTTGRPKGAMLTHFNIVHSTLHYESTMALTAADRGAAVVPLSHVTGLVGLLMVMVRVAGTLLVTPAFKAADFLAFAERERMTFTVMVPAMYNLCLLQEGFGQRDLSAWRVGAYGGAPMPTATIDALAGQLPGLVLMNAYGATETTSPSTLMPPGQTDGHRDSVGRTVQCGHILIMGEDGREVPRGETGEIWIGGPMVVKGYWDNPAATAENFTGGYWHSGDIGSMDSDGYLYVFDRRKDMLNRGGYKIYSVEVENTLCQHPAILEAAVVGKPCPVLGERVHVFVTLKEGMRLDQEELITFCAERLADYKVPESVTLRREALPRNANGKLLKRELRDQLLSDQKATA